MDGREETIEEEMTEPEEDELEVEGRRQGNKTELEVELRLTEGPTPQAGPHPACEERGVNHLEAWHCPCKRRELSHIV